jgi:glycosyltransferase involved in cell wall biosynthesis
MSIKVSVVIPTYKRPALLLKCISQLAQQTFYKNEYEVIVVTDGIDFNTVTELTEFIQQHPSVNLSCYNLNQKKGPAAARNKGVENAKGELVLFTDDDCLPQQDWITSYWNAYDALNKQAAAFTGKTIVPYAAKPTDYEKNIANLETAEFITANCAIVKKVFEKLGGFNENFPIAWREDSDMHFKLIKNNIPVFPVKDAVVIHPVRKAGWGVSLKEQKKSAYNALLYKEHASLYKQRISNEPVWNYYAMIILFFFAVLFEIKGLHIATMVAFTCWLLLVADFTHQRLKSTSKHISHVVEMIFTSALIPFLSVFWTLYGSFKYKTFLL